MWAQEGRIPHSLWGGGDTTMPRQGGEGVLASRLPFEIEWVSIRLTVWGPLLPRKTGEAAADLVGWRQPWDW